MICVSGADPGSEERGVRTPPPPTPGSATVYYNMLYHGMNICSVSPPIYHVYHGLTLNIYSSGIRFVEWSDSMDSNQQTLEVDPKLCQRLVFFRIKQTRGLTL